MKINIFRRFSAWFSTTFFIDFMNDTIRILDRQIMQFKILEDKYGLDMRKEIIEIKRTKNMLLKKVETKDKWLLLDK